MKKFLVANKKLSFALLAGLLTTAIAVGGIFAWFTATAGVNQGDIDTAEVGVEIANDGTGFLYEWAPYGLTLQREFIGGIDAAATLADKAAYLGEFWAAHDLIDLIVPKDYFDPNTAYMFMPPEITLGDPDSGPFKVTPGSILQYNVRYTNTSNIPVYMRFKAPAICAWKDGLPPLELPTHILGMIALDGRSYWDIELAYEDGYYYFTKPLGLVDAVVEGDFITELGDRDAYINLVTYVDHNMDGYQGGIIDFSGLEVEVIQATNNAPYLAWGVEDVVFEPYVAP